MLSGSCSKKNNTAEVQCTQPLLHPVYGQFLFLLFFFCQSHPRTDLSILTSSTPNFSIPRLLLNAPPYIAFSLGSVSAFFLLYMLTAYRYKLGKMGQSFDSRAIQKWILFFGVLGIIIGTPAINLVSSIFLPL